MIIGFTGTQKGLTEKQKDMLQSLLQVVEGAKEENELHHGDCVGADAEAHEFAVESSFRVVIHPPNINDRRAFCHGGLILPPKSYLDRNQDIVDSCKYLVGCPASMKEEIRSGTWSTIRRARKKGIPIIIIWPNGAYTQENKEMF
jgi:hypothetical protein